MLLYWKELGGKKGEKFEENYKTIKSLIPKSND